MDVGTVATALKAAGRALHATAPMHPAERTHGRTHGRTIEQAGMGPSYAALDSAHLGVAVGRHRQLPVLALQVLEHLRRRATVRLGRDVDHARRATGLLQQREELLRQQHVPDHVRLELLLEPVRALGAIAAHREHDPRVVHQQVQLRVRLRHLGRRALHRRAVAQVHDELLGAAAGGRGGLHLGGGRLDLVGGAAGDDDPGAEARELLGGLEPDAGVGACRGITLHAGCPCLSQGQARNASAERNEPEELTRHRNRTRRLLALTEAQRTRSQARAGTRQVVSCVGLTSDERDLPRQCRVVNVLAARGPLTRAVEGGSAKHHSAGCHRPGARGPCWERGCCSGHFPAL